MTAGVFHLRQEVRGDDDRTTSGRVISQYSAHRLDLRWIEAIGRLIQYERSRHSEHGLRDAESLQHPMAVPAHPAVDRRTKAGNLQRLVQVCLMQRTTGRVPVRHQVRPAAEVRQETGALDQGADRARAHRRRRAPAGR